jgi:hypothetical protein
LKYNKNIIIFHIFFIMLTKNNSIYFVCFLILILLFIYYIFEDEICFSDNYDKITYNQLTSDLDYLSPLALPIPLSKY